VWFLCVLCDVCGVVPGVWCGVQVCCVGCVCVFVVWCVYYMVCCVVCECVCGLLCVGVYVVWFV